MATEEQNGRPERVHGFVVGLPWSQHGARRFLPTAPVWPAFAGNTLFYATLLWLLTLGPLVMRRYLRVRRGVCPACSYPMGATDVCTECGVTLPTRARPAT